MDYALAMGSPVPSVVELSFAVEEPRHRWLLEERDVPETPLHDAVIDLLKLVLRRWVDAHGRSALVARNLGCRWDPEDARVGTDPDLVLVEPHPPEGEALRTLRVWEGGHPPPRIAVEVVSETEPEKDYVEAPLRCARLGARELWVFDPTLAGPDETGGPFSLQIWRLDRSGERARMDRVYAGPGPGFSEELGAWLVVTDRGARLRIADDRTGRALWPTDFEAERDRSRAAVESERDRSRAAVESERDRSRAAVESERARAARLADALRELGVDPDTL